MFNIWSFVKGVRGKKGEGAEWELGKIILAVIFLILLVGAIILLFSGKGKEVLDSIKEFLRFGGKGR